MRVWQNERERAAASAPQGHSSPMRRDSEIKSEEWDCQRVLIMIRVKPSEAWVSAPEARSQQKGYFLTTFIAYPSVESLPGLPLESIPLHSHPAVLALFQMGALIAQTKKVKLKMHHNMNDNKLYHPVKDW